MIFLGIYLLKRSKSTNSNTIMIMNGKSNISYKSKFFKNRHDHHFVLFIFEINIYDPK
jgi:hypothetical protein